ncbi:beta-hexosaminidase subunit beta-like [Antedon mediterranea]|uniref:beta-hexosaminidase subunit beta-like n=1 Tax=Antedon mediterranea TaxID=105859 RepID=UPI003AF6EB51
MLLKLAALFVCILLHKNVFCKPHNDLNNIIRNVEDIIRQSQDDLRYKPETEGLGLPAAGGGGAAADLGETVNPTTGSPWPLPQQIKTTTSMLFLNKVFKFNYDSKTCDLLQMAFTRYYNLIFYGTQQVPSNIENSTFRLPKVNEPSISSMIVTMDICPDYPTLESNENYTLSVASDGARIKAATIWGVLRGLETFSQLIYESSDGGLAVNATTITDFPRFLHRGILVDTSRHFIDVPTLLDNFDAMVYNKFNVFHWHIVDDQSFPYESSKYPQLSNWGAFDQRHTYTQDQVSLVISYARERGIRVVPEYDTPGHSQSWGSINDLLTPCYKDGKATGSFGPINPILNSTYDILKDFFGEVVAKYPDHYIHMGGDEVSFDCWKSNPDITAFMKEQQFGDDYAKLEEYYMQRLLDIMSDLQAGYIIWQEVIDNGVKVRNDTVVEVWKGGYVQEMSKVTKQGYRTILSSPWYLNYVSNPYNQDWKTYYIIEPQDFTGTAEQKALVIGGEACMWGEYVDSVNLIQRLWPRASAVGERLWSSKSVNDVPAATSRLAEHRCRMLRRGIQAEPVTGPGYCP